MRWEMYNVKYTYNIQIFGGAHSQRQVLGKKKNQMKKNGMSAHLHTVF